MRLQGKVVVITGSGSGLGRDGALLFAREGATAVASDVVPGPAPAVAKEVEAAGGTATAIDADVRSEDDVRRLVRDAVAAHGRIDVMWANAGIPDPGVGTPPFIDSPLGGLGRHLRDQRHRHQPRVAGGRQAHGPARRGRHPAGDDVGVGLRLLPGVPDVHGQQRRSQRTRAGGGAGARQIGHPGQRPRREVLRGDAAVGSRHAGDAAPLRSPTDPARQRLPGALPRLRRIRVHVRQTIQSADGGTFARTSIIFPTELGRSDDITAGSIPDELRTQIRR